MADQISSTNPVVKAIIGGTAPPQARMAAARGMLPIPQADLIEVLVFLQGVSDDLEVAEAAKKSLLEQDKEGLGGIAQASETTPAVLDYLARRIDLGHEIQQHVVLNTNTPDTAIATLAARTTDGAIIELIVNNQQRIVRAPAILDAVLANEARTPEADRRARETHKEFFEKERGAQQIAEELRARGESAAAEFMEKSNSVGVALGLTTAQAMLLAKHIEVSDSDIDDTWLGLEFIEELLEETYEQRLANAERIIGETQLEGGELPPERLSLIRLVMLMSTKDRVKLALKGDREARAILIRDSNKLVASGVMHNPRVTDQEVEKIAAMRMVSDEVLRLIGMNRAWTRSYPVIHNLVRNPRAPLATTMTLLQRLLPRDLKGLSLNRNVSDSVRKQAARILSTRGGH